MPMTTRIAAGIEILDAKGVNHAYRSQFSLPTLLWRMGFTQPPPHFEGFWRSSVSNGLFFGAGLGLIIWWWDGPSFSEVLLRAAVGGAFCGLAMAVYYWYIRRKHDLPVWSEIRVD